MLRRIRIKNFQRHRRLDVETDRLTSIVGNSDAGKSAIIRAIRWVMFNKPAGLGFITKGKDETRVRLDFDGFGVSRIRSAKVNEYRLHVGGKTKTLKAFKNEPPDEVVEMLNVNGVNLQSQFDAPFWLGMNEMQASRALNEVVNLQSLDSARDKLTSMVREHNQEIKTTRKLMEAVVESEKELEKFNTKRLKALCKLADELVDQSVRDALIEQELTGVIDSIDDSQDLEIKLSIQLEALAGIKKAEALKTQIEEGVKEADELTDLIDECVAISHSCHELGTRLAEVHTLLKEFKLCPKCQTPLQS